MFHRPPTLSSDPNPQPPPPVAPFALTLTLHFQILQYSGAPVLDVLDEATTTLRGRVPAESVPLPLSTNLRNLYQTIDQVQMSAQRRDLHSAVRRARDWLKADAQFMEDFNGRLKAHAAPSRHA